VGSSSCLHGRAVQDRARHSRPRLPGDCANRLLRQACATLLTPGSRSVAREAPRELDVTYRPVPAAARSSGLTSGTTTRLQRREREGAFRAPNESGDRTRRGRRSTTRQRYRRLWPQGHDMRRSPLPPRPPFPCARGQATGASSPASVVETVLAPDPGYR